jgi:hypothetical protein
VFRFGFAFALLVSLASHDAFATNRHIRTTLDDQGQPASEVRVLPESHADFPLTIDPPSVVQGRLIRLTLDDEGPAVYGRLTQQHASARRFRPTLE